MLLGFSTGFLHKIIQPVSREAIFLCQEIGCNIIELSCSYEERIPLLENIKKSDLESFKKVSLHAPSSIFLKKDRELKLILNTIQEACKRLEIDYIIVHPNIVRNWNIFNDYTFQVAIENMDRYGETGKTVKELANIFNHKNYKLVLDLNHCFTNDKTMKLADEFIKSFKDKICEIHLSGYKDKNNLHVPLHKTRQVNIIKVVPNKRIPIIIESECKDFNEAKKEYFYIKNYLLENK